MYRVYPGYVGGGFVERSSSGARTSSYLSRLAANGGPCERERESGRGT